MTEIDAGYAKIPAPIRSATVEFLIAWHMAILQIPSVTGKGPAETMLYTASKPPVAGKTIGYLWETCGENAALSVWVGNEYQVRVVITGAGRLDVPPFDALYNAWMDLIRPYDQGEECPLSTPASFVSEMSSTLASIATPTKET
jgi:hypothetical protein